MPVTTSENDIKERLSFAYLTAVAGGAGCQLASFAIDKESVDAIIRPVQGSSRQVDVQMKATSAQVATEGVVSFSLSVKNYDTLRRTDHINPHYLIVLHLPGKLTDWLSISPTELAIRGVAYYGNLYGLPAVSNTSSRVVTMPQSQRFDVGVMTRMIEASPKMIGKAGG